MMKTMTLTTLCIVSVEMLPWAMPQFERNPTTRDEQETMWISMMNHLWRDMCGVYTLSHCYIWNIVMYLPAAILTSHHVIRAHSLTYSHTFTERTSLAKAPTVLSSRRRPMSLERQSPLSASPLPIQPQKVESHATLFEKLVSWRNWITPMWSNYLTLYKRNQVDSILSLNMSPMIWKRS